MSDPFLEALQAEIDSRQEEKDPFLEALTAEIDARQEDEPAYPQDMADYAQQLQSQGGYTEDDLLAAGYSEDQVSAYEAEISAGRPEVSGAVLGAGEDDKLFSAAPATDMYDGYLIGYPTDDVNAEGDVTAYAIYNSFINSPNTEKNALGNYIYSDPVTGQRFRIPKPEIKGTVSGTLSPDEYLMDPDKRAQLPAGVSLGTLAIDGVRDSGTEVIELGAAIADLSWEKMTGNDPALTEWVQETLPKTSTGFSESDALIKEGLGLAVGFFGGSAVGKGAVKIGGKTITALTDNSVLQPIIKELAPTTNRLLQFNPAKLGSEIGGAAGTAAAMDSETETLLFGENGLLKTDAIEVLGVKASDDAAEQVLNARLNIFADALVGAGIVEGGLRGAKKAIQFVNDVSVSQIVVRATGSVEGAKQRAAKAILDELSAVEATSTGETLEATRERLIQVIRENAEVILEEQPAGQSNADLVLDVFTALEKDGAVKPATLAKIRGMRTGAATNAGNSSSLIEAMDGPSRVVDEKLSTRIDESFSEGNDPTRVVDTIVAQQSVRQQNQMNEIIRLQDAIAQNDVDFVRSMLGDGRFGPIVTKVMGTSPSQISSLSEDALMKVARGAVDEINALNATKNDLFNQIPEGVPFDYDAFGNVLKEVTSNRNPMDTSGNDVLGNKLIRRLVSSFKRKEGGETIGFDEGMNLTIETVEQDPAAFAAELLKSGADFKTLHNQVRPEISNLIEEAYRNGDKGAAQQLIKLRSFIDDQIEWVAQNTDNVEASEAADAAMTFYKQEFVPILRDDPLEALDQTVTSNTRVSPDGTVTELKPTRIFNESNQTVSNIMNEGTRADVNQLLSLLGRDATSVSSADVEEYITANIFEGLYQSIRQGGLDNLTDAQVSQLVQDYGVQLRALGDDSLLATQLDDFTQRILASRGSKEQMEQALTEAETVLESMKDDAFAKLVQPFLNKYSDDLMATANPEVQLRSFITGKDGPDRVRELITATDDNPIIREGLENAFYRELRDGLMGATETVSGARVFKPTEVRKLLEGEGKLTAVAAELFKDDPASAKLIDAVIALADRGASGRNARIIPGMSGTAEVQAYQAAVNRIIYATVGPLNQLGTKMRAAANLVADKADITGVFDDAMAMVTSDARTFADVAEEIVRKEKTIGLAGIRVDRELADKAFRLAVRAGLYTQADEDKNEFLTSWEQAFEAEKAIRNTADNVKDSLRDSMINLFNLYE